MPPQETVQEAVLEVQKALTYLGISHALLSSGPEAVHFCVSEAAFVRKGDVTYYAPGVPIRYDRIPVRYQLRGGP
jgi:hypothetical protein